MNSAIEAEFYAKEAQRLLHDVTLLEAMRRMRVDATEALIRADATKVHDVVRLQAKISVIDELSDELRLMVETFALKDRPAHF